MCGVFLLVQIRTANSQAIINNGVVFRTETGVIANIQGAVENNNNGTFANTGTLIIQDDFTNNANVQGDGTVRLSGDWYNNGVFTADAGTFVMEGADQLIAGSVQSDFNNLELDGTGIKILGLNASSSGILGLNNVELATDANTFFVTNTSTGAVTRGSGFVSSQGSGAFSRQTASTGIYLFPVGSSVGVTRYRPTEITPDSANANTFTVILNNYNATIDGWDINLKTPDIEVANPDFYTEIKRPFGTTPATLSLYYDDLFDATYTGMAHWKSGQWNSISGVTMLPGGLSRITTSSWVDFSTAPFILTKDEDSLVIPPPTAEFELVIYNTFTPDDNGQNDTWQIDNIDQFPNNEVKVFNRWGGLVYEASPYVNDWDGTIGGEKLPITAYYYIVKAGDDTPAYTGTVNITR